LPKGRSAKYVYWRFYERFGILPPDIEEDFNNNSAWQQAQIFAYENIREIEEFQNAS